MANKKKTEPEVEETVSENISVEPMEEVMGDRYATYAKYVIQDRAIPDVRDGMKPVQRRIIFSMFKSGNTFNKPTKKCAHTVGAVMGTFHPHGDSSIYEALARMSQDWKVRYPLVDFQGNNGSIDGDSPAAYRYTESRLSELSNELVRDIDKQTVDMQLNFDDTELEPTVLPARFPNLYVNGAEGIAVGMATEIPPHNLREMIDAIIFRIGHKTATIEDLMNFVKGPDFPMGGYIYNSDGLKSIYTTGRGRIEVAAKSEIVPQDKIQQIVITEIPYKVQKNLLVYSIDLIRHSKAIDGILEVRDESEGDSIRIVVDVKKEAKADLILKYLESKTNLKTSYTANIVAIDNGHPRTLNLLDYVDTYIAHQVDVITRKTTFDLAKSKARLHIVDGLILASLNINEVVDIIRKSKDKADSKENLMKRYHLSNEQAEAIVTMPLYKLSHTDEIVLENEKKQLEKDIEEMEGILSDPNKLNRSLVKDLKAIATKYGDDRRTKIVEKGEETKVDKRDLIAEELVEVAATYDGYIKRSSVKSFRSSDSILPGMKETDTLISYGTCLTTDYLLCFTNQGNYISVPVHSISESKWKDEGTHLNEFATLSSGEKVIKAIALHMMREDIYLAVLTRYGQIKRMALSALDNYKRPRSSRYIKLLNGDSVAAVTILTGNSDVVVITSDGNASMFNENQLTIIGTGASGVKSVTGLGGKVQTVAMLALDEEEKAKLALFTNKGHQRIVDFKSINKTNRLGKMTTICSSFKGDPHLVVSAIKIPNGLEVKNLFLSLEGNITLPLTLKEFKVTEAAYARKNISDIPARTNISNVYDIDLETVNEKTTSHPIVANEKQNKNVTKESALPEGESAEVPDGEAKKEENFEQISIFDDLEK